MRKVIFDSIFTAAQSEAVRSKRPATDNVNTEDVGAKTRNIATTSPSPDQHMQDGTTVTDSLVVSSTWTKRKDRRDDIRSPSSPVPQPPDATRLHLSHDCAGLVDEAGGNRSTKSGERGPSRRMRTRSVDTHARLMRSAKSSGCLISGDTMQPSEPVNNEKHVYY